MQATARSSFVMSPKSQARRRLIFGRSVYTMKTPAVWALIRVFRASLISYSVCVLEAVARWIRVAVVERFVFVVIRPPSTCDVGCWQFAAFIAALSFDLGYHSRG